MNSLGEALKGLREGRRLSQSRLAQLLDEHRTTIAYRESGRTGVTIDGLEAICRKLGVTIVLTGDGWEIVDERRDALPSNPERDQPLDESDRLKSLIPILGRASAGPGAFVDDDGQEYVSVAEVWGRRLDGAVVVEGDSMAPMLKDGDLVGVRREDDLRAGDVVVAVDRRVGTVHIKVWPGEQEGFLLLTSINPEHPPIICRDQSVELVGVAWGLVRRERLRV